MVVRNGAAGPQFVVGDVGRVGEHEIHAAGGKLRKHGDTIAVDDGVAGMAATPRLGRGRCGAARPHLRACGFRTIEAVELFDAVPDRVDQRGNHLRGLPDFALDGIAGGPSVQHRGYFIEPFLRARSGVDGTRELFGSFAPRLRLAFERVDIDLIAGSDEFPVDKRVVFGFLGRARADAKVSGAVIMYVTRYWRSRGSQNNLLTASG